jgi:hypothetical protein
VQSSTARILKNAVTESPYKWSLISFPIDLIGNFGCYLMRDLSASRVAGADNRANAVLPCERRAATLSAAAPTLAASYIQAPREGYRLGDDRERSKSIGMFVSWPRVAAARPNSTRSTVSGFRFPFGLQGNSDKAIASQMK